MTILFAITFAGLTALVVMLSIWAVGVLLVTALLIVPAAARNVARSVGTMFWWAMLVSATSAVAGLLISAQDWARTAPGPTVVLCAFVWFMASHISVAMASSSSGFPITPDPSRTPRIPGRS